MPYPARMYSDPTKGEYYVSAETVTWRQAWLLEDALNGRVTIEGLLARWAS